MLTIKHVEHSGHETVLQCSHTSYHHHDANPELIAFGVTARGGAIDEFGVCRYNDGLVYVMNDHGATVGKYDLGSARVGDS